MNKNLVTDIQIIDHQHQEFHTMIETLLLDMMDMIDMEEYYEIRKYILFLDKYTEKHFKLEEDLMLETNYPKIAEHKKQHEYYIATYKKYAALFAAGEFATKDLYDFHTFLIDWYKEDIRDHDLEMAHFIKAYAENDPSIVEKLNQLYQKHFKEEH